MNAVDPSLIDVRVARKTVEAEGICGLELVAVDGAELPAFTAGAHVDVHLPGGVVRQYSLCNAPHERYRYCLGVLRDPASRGGSVAVHEQLHDGSILRISTPKNHFPLDESARHSLLLAGGIGITPLLAMAERLAVLGSAFALHVATRSPARTAYAQRLRASAYASSVHFHHDDGAAGQQLSLPKLLATPQADTQVYVCGPKGFLDAVRTTARAQGWPDAQVHFEYFSGGAVHTAADLGFDVVLHRSGRVIRVAAGQTVAEALQAHDVPVPMSCQQGVCGTCLTRVLEGEVDHKDLYLTPEEQAVNDQFLPCCSRAKGRWLVLDL